MKDELFLRGESVPMTKEVVRALALSRLNLSARAILLILAQARAVSPLRLPSATRSYR
jgi:cobalt-precorrin-6B (C15)-methyltransferase